MTTQEQTKSTWKVLGIIGLIVGILGLILSLFGGIGMYLGIVGIILSGLGAFLATKQGGKMVLPVIALLISLAAAGNGYRMSLKYQEAFDEFSKELQKTGADAMDKLQKDLEEGNY